MQHIYPMEYNVLSLFDGKSCARIALEKAGKKVNKYFASEIDKYAIRVTQANYPDTIQLGDIRKVKATNLPKIDLIVGGSPCQGFSRAGKGLNFQDERSKLFFEYIRLLRECRKKNPKILFFLENVDMIQEWQDIISREMGISPIKINSALVSAQNRVRLYWTNIGTTSDMFGHLIPGIPQPKDRGIVLKDILEDRVDERYFLSSAAVNRLTTRHENYRPQVNPNKTGTILSGNQSGKNTDNGTTYITNKHFVGNYKDKDKGNPLTATMHKGALANGQSLIEQIGGTINNFEFKANKANSIDANYFKGRDNHGARTVIQINPSLESGGVQPYQQNRIYSEEGVLPALSAELSGRNHIETKSRIRRLTPIECSRLQGVPDEYLYHLELTHGGGKALSDTQRYKLLGNGWQIDTIVHIFKYI